jgi:hypothetical protein
MDCVHDDFAERYSDLLKTDNQTYENKIINYVNFWPTFAEAFSFIYTKHRKSIDQNKCSALAYKWLYALDCMNYQGVTRPILCASLIKFSKPNFAKVARWCEIYTFRTHALGGRRVDKYAKRIISLAHRILFDNLSTETVGQILCRWLDEVSPLKVSFDFLTDGGVITSLLK